MKNDYSVSDMERIQKGLEEFLQQETENREPQLYDLRAELEDAEVENDDIEKFDFAITLLNITLPLSEYTPLFVLS